MKTIIVKNNTYKVPTKHRLTERNRRVAIKTPFTTVIRTLLKDNFRESVNTYFLDKRRKGMEEDVMEINGEMFNVRFVK